MLFGKLLQSVNDGDENDLFEMEQELRRGIDKVKSMASSCKINAEDDAAFCTNEAGVPLVSRRNSSTPSSREMSTTTKSSGRLISRTSSVFLSSRTCPRKHLNSRVRFKIQKYIHKYEGSSRKVLQTIQTEKQEKKQKIGCLNIKKLYLSL